MKPRNPSQRQHDGGGVAYIESPSCSSLFLCCVMCITTNATEEASYDNTFNSRAFEKWANKVELKVKSPKMQKPTDHSSTG